MKKNKLYKVNKWNQPAFMVDRMHHNIFDGFSGSTLVRPDMFEHQGSYQSPTVQLAGSSVSTLGRNAGNEFSRSLLNNKPATIDNAPQTAAPKESGSKSSGFDTSAMMSFGLGSIPTTPIEYNGTTYRRGAWDLLDPTYQLSGAKSSEAGDILSDMGVAATKTGDPWAMMTGSVLKQVGSVVNALWGSELYEDNIKRVEDEIAGMNRQANVMSGSENNEDYMRNSQGMNTGWNFTQDDIGKDGLFAHKAKDTYNDLKRKQDIGRAALRTGIVLGARSADRNIDDAARRNFVYAYGGPLGQYNGDDMGAIEYGFMTDYLTQKKRENDMKSKMSGIVSMPAFMPNSFAIGGDTDESAASQLARGWYDGTIGGFVNMGKIVGKEVGKLFSSDKGNFGGGSYNGAGRTSRWKPAYKPKNKDNFNKAFDEARKAGAETFMFGDKEYSTTKEANPVREFNNRHVGAGRTEEMIRQRGTYGRDFGPITGRYSLLPVIPYALGGDLQTNGGDFSTGLVHINAGDSHETNPNEGVQLGVDDENVPNLVEEGETVYENYVFSNRILADEATKQMFRLPKKKDVTFADISKRLEKEIAERPSDPISKAGFEKQMQMLEEQQERQKQEMEAERAKAAFEALSPEEQTALMRQRAEQEAMAQQAVAEQQAAMQQPTPEELAIAQQQQQMADGSEAALGQEVPMMAEGGHLFSRGGEMKKRIYKLLGIHTDSEFNKWVKDNNIPAFQDRVEHIAWDRIFENTDFVDALSKDNPALKDALTKGYDFGAYQPIGKGKATIQSISKGNWKTTNGKGWRGSDDLAFKQATEGLSDAEIDALTTEQLAERMRKTAAYQNTNKWLQNSDNALQYLNTLLNDPNTPEVAREYARKFVKDGKWKDGFNYDYATVFGSNGKGVRETNPGTYWHTALEANRGNQTGNFVINEDGTIEPIIGDVPTDWTSAGNYAWSDENNDYAYNYYKRPVVTTSSPQLSTEEETPEGTKKKGTAPTHRPEWLRYTGLLGPAAGLGLMAAGVGRPDTAQLDAAIQDAGNVTTANWKPLGNYLTYRPFDVWYANNRLSAESRATDRALMNTSGGNRGTAMAGLVANGYNNQIAQGNLFRQAQEYNDDLREKVATFNRDTDKWNSDQYGRTSQFNADARNRARQASAQLRLQAANSKLDSDTGWYNSLYGNLSGLFKGLSDIGTENYRMNRIAEMGADGLFGVLGDSYTGRRVLKHGKGGKKSK